MATKRLELEFASEPVDFHCPVCGVRLFRSGCPDAVCPHLLFRAESVGRTWKWCHSASRVRLEAEIDRLYAEKSLIGFCGTREEFMDGLPVERIVDCVAKTVPRKSVFLISISTSDVGCGGMYNGTLYALIDYRPQRSKLIEKIS